QCFTASYIDKTFGELFLGRLVALARSVAEDKFKPVAYHEIMPAFEREQVTNLWNDTAVKYNYEGGLVGMMQKCAVRDPAQTALIFRDEEISFEEFNARVNQLAHKLMDMGVGKDDFVCICMERSIELVVAIWATIKAGGAYVPLNTADPDARIAEIISDCEPKAVLTQEALVEKLPASDVLVAVEPGATNLDEWSKEDPDFLPDPDALAYMIYTSGSTGKPKGVTVEHNAIHNRVVWMHEEYGLTSEDRILQKTPYTFDVSVWEFLWSFAYGSTLVVAEPNGHVAMRYLYDVMERHRVTHLHFVPSVFRLFLMLPELDKLPIKKLFCSGEALGFDSVETFYKKANADAEVHNLYGPTEAAVDVSYYHCKRNPSDSVIPIGKPVSNTGLYVLDKNDQPLPVGVPGELHIGGVQLARGYWAREELTKDRFVFPTMLNGVAHERLYKTGDLAFFRPDSEIIYMGRNDFQVKLNGVRIELGEIEAVIRDDEATQDVVVVAEENQGNKTLTAYVVSENPGPKKADELRTMIADSRPPYYVPRDIKFLEKMPLTASGKINRKVLQAQPEVVVEELQQDEVKMAS
ncbi:MAG: amino acid adenylation domain-containing protein, partial [Rhizobiaceae bacterium]|nr:amino acid adenylation domain-containing protein [Rhizobiaceae bacterium]